MSKPRLNVAFLNGDAYPYMSLARVLGPPLAAPESQPDSVEPEFGELHGHYGVHGGQSFSEFKTPTRKYTAIDYGPDEKPRRLLLNGVTCLDAAVLTVIANQGLGITTREHVLLLREAGVRHVVIFVDTSNLGGELDMVDLTEHETRARLAEYGFPADDFPAVRGDLFAAIRRESDNCSRVLDEVRATLDSFVPVPRRADQGAFLFSTDFATVQDEGAVVAGWAERGRVEAGDALEVVGGTAPPRSVVVTGVLGITSDLRRGRAGRRLSLIVSPSHSRDESRSQPLERRQRREAGSRPLIQAGEVLATPGSVQVFSRFDADCYLATRREGGTEKSLGDGEQVRFLLRSREAPGVVRLLESERQVWPGRRFRMRAELPADCATVMEPGFRFAFRDEEGLSGYGIVQEVYR